jgi:hypothetical protein
MQIHKEFRGIPGSFTLKNTAEFRGIPRNSVCFSKNSVFRRKSKTHFRGHPSDKLVCVVVDKDHELVKSLNNTGDHFSLAQNILELMLGRQAGLEQLKKF